MCVSWNVSLFPFLQIACDEILRRLKPFQVKNPKGNWEDWVRIGIAVACIRHLDSHSDSKTISESV